MTQRGNQATALLVLDKKSVRSRRRSSRLCECSVLLNLMQLAGYENVLFELSEKQQNREFKREIKAKREENIKK